MTMTVTCRKISIHLAKLIYLIARAMPSDTINRKRIKKIFFSRYTHVKQETSQRCGRQQRNIKKILLLKNGKLFLLLLCSCNYGCVSVRTDPFSLIQSIIYIYPKHIDPTKAKCQRSVPLSKHKA